MDVSPDVAAAPQPALALIKSHLHTVPEFPRHDGLLFTRIDVSLVVDLTDIGPVAQEQCEDSSRLGRRCTRYWGGCRRSLGRFVQL